MDEIVSTGYSTDDDEDDYYFYDAEDPQDWRLNEKELSLIAKNIGHEWRDIGIHLGYNYATLEHLEDIYDKSPVWRNFVMIAKWCDIMSSCNIQAKGFLGKLLEESGNAMLAQKLNIDASNFTGIDIPYRVKEYIECVSFDRPLENCLLQYDLSKVRNYIGYPKQNIYCLNININSSTIEDIPSKITPVSKGNEQLSTWSMKSMKNALSSDDADAHTNNVMQLVSELSLSSYYPSKISLSDIQEITILTNNPSQKDLPWLLLKRLFMMNYTCRETDLTILYDKCQPENEDDIFCETNVSAIHPSDLLYVTFLCCDQLLKRIVIQNLFNCKLAVPFLYKDSDSKVVMSHWALRSILIDTKKDDISVQISSLENETKTIAFVKFGDNSISKSKVLNDVLCDRQHPCFYNSDCPLGSAKRTVSTGIVEAAWYIPAGRNEDIFDEFLTFLNLRGNALENIAMLDHLCKISQIFVVNLHITQLTKRHAITLLKWIHERGLHVVYAFEMGDQMIISKEIWQKYQTEMEIYKSKMKILTLGTSHKLKGSSDVTSNMRKQLKLTLTQVNAIPLEEPARSLDMNDERMNENCWRGRQMALNAFSTLSKHIKVEKGKLFPLQSKVWLDWCDKLKTLYRTDSGKDCNILKLDLQLKREKQIDLVRNELHPFMTRLITHLVTSLEVGVDDCLYFLTWIKMLLDKSSRSELPRLLHAYRDKWARMKSVSNDEKMTNLLKDEVLSAEKELVEASIGYEHIVREMGQIYESVVETKTYADSVFGKFPNMIAKLMIKGFPLEIMDGDTAMVPLHWVQAVFNELAKEIGDQKLLTISVLGIQSSGKSTLLNCMFGIDFAVSAGRCTRGIYAQLVKVQNKLLPFGYVLVIDTEGLRAPELGDNNREHDNELATFVLGLGNITIINIKGENSTEIEDVLQIAVHAFIRLQLANGNLKLQQTCIFVHQDVPAIDAKSKMTHARQKMIDKLDELTAQAAVREGVSEIKFFNQVIRIEPNSHIWYFSGLLFGDPPMAPINLGYSRNVAEVKERILFEFSMERKTFLSITETKTLLKDLWTAILSENFVFTFKNSLEVKAYHEMETKFQSCVWGIEKEILSFLHKDAHIKITSCSTETELEEQTQELSMNIKPILENKTAKEISEFNKFIENCPLSDIMKQWQQIRNICIKERENQIQLEAMKFLIKAKTCRHAELLHSKRQDIEVDIRLKAQDLARRCRDKGMTEHGLKRKFEQTWSTWIPDLKRARVSTSRDIQNEIEELMRNLFNSDKTYLVSELKETDVSKIMQLQRLQDSMSLDDLHKRHFSIESEGMFKRIPILLSHYKPLKTQALMLINTLFSNLDTLLYNMSKMDTPYDKSCAKELFMTLKNFIDIHNAKVGELTNFLFTAALRAKLVLHVAHYMISFFSVKNHKYETTHNVESQLNELRASTWKLFKEEFEDRQAEVKMVNPLLTSLRRILVDQVERDIPYVIVDYFLQYHFSTKSSLICFIMKFLANEGNFLDFMSYFSDGKTYALKCVTNFIENKIFEVHEKGTIYKIFVDELTTEYTRIIEETIKSSLLDSRNITIATWAELFERNLSRKMALKPGTFQYFKTFRINEPIFFGHNLLEQLPLLQNEISDICSKNSQKGMRWKEINPYTYIIDNIWGCDEKCPFCRETCKITHKNHLPTEKHSCVQHRLPGISGTRFEKTNDMVWESCNFAVASSYSFYCGASNKRCQKVCGAKGDIENLHKCMDYQKYLPDWYIQPSAVKDTSYYWMWFVFNFKKELSKFYGYKIPTSIKRWQNVTKKKAIQSLDRGKYERL